LRQEVHICFESLDHIKRHSATNEKRSHLLRVQSCELSIVSIQNIIYEQSGLYFE